MQLPDPVLAKKQCYRLWQAGEFGNKLRAWSVDGWRVSGFGGQVKLRTTLGGGGPCSDDLSPDAVPLVLGLWERRRGVSPNDVVVCEAADARAAVLQGEYLNDVLGEYLDGVLVGGSWGHFRHSRERLHMREALAADSRTSTGLVSGLILREAMTPSSWEDWQLLLERYPGHVLEVSVYDRCVGDVPGRNALVWEVRRY